MTSRTPRPSNTAQLVLATALLAISASSAASWPAELRNEDGLPSLAPVLERVTQAVVNISATRTATRSSNPYFDDPFWRRFFGVPDESTYSLRPSVGSGVIIDSDRGLIVTNHHVIENADEITVTLLDRRSFEARLIGSDARTDVALLRIEAPDLHSVDFTNSDSLTVGDFVLAVGNPFGLGQSSTSGIVSALGRAGFEAGAIEDFIQTDAPINPGNSGGALVNLNGQLVGVNAAIIGPTGYNVGIGFAIPSNIARYVVEELLNHGEVRRGMLGIVFRDVDERLAAAFELEGTDGVFVTAVKDFSAAHVAGIQVEDVIRSVNNKQIIDKADLVSTIALMHKGDEMSIELVRDGKNQTVLAVLGETPKAPISSLESLPGVEVRNLQSDDHAFVANISGVLIASVDASSSAGRSGLLEGDIVLRVNRQDIGSVSELEDVLSNRGPPFFFRILRGNRVYVVQIT